jgi:16S rRNA (adenine1518-N6/adenine1519-N6)-dimethyltransferase
VADL